MSATVKQLILSPIDDEDCRHRLPVNRCQRCQMAEFLLIRKQLSTECDFPFLLRDVCTVIFSLLPKYSPPPRDSAYRLRDCGYSRRPNSEENDGHLQVRCGVEFISAAMPGQVLFCTRSAVKNGVCGSWTCSAHSKRESVSIQRRAAKLSQ